jgi:hypothetical protein
MAVLEKELETVTTKTKPARRKTTKKAGTAAVGAARKATAKKKTATRKTATKKVAGARGTRKTPGAAKTLGLAAEERQRMIAEAAYYLAERRGFSGGDPRQDWLDAEASIDAMLIDQKARKG